VLVLVEVLAGSCTGTAVSIAGVPVGLVAGAGAKVLRDVLIHPIDTVKNRRQLSSVRLPTGEGDGDGRLIYSNLYDGIGPSLITGIPAGALYLYIADVLQAEQHVNSGLAGAAASFVFWTVRTPGEVLKTRMQLASRAATRALQPAPGLGETLRAMREEEGLGALFSGYALTLSRSVSLFFLLWWFRVV